MNKISQLSLISLFDEIRKGESAHNKIKMKLNLPSRTLQIESVFNEISKNSRHITPSRLSEYLNQTMQVTQNDVYCIFKKFDTELKGEIDINDFKKQLEIVQTDNKKTYDYHNKGQGIEELLIQLFKSYLGYQDLLNVCRRQLKFQLLYQMFDEIARERNGYISKNELINFYQYNDRILKQSSCIFLINGLKRRSFTKITLEAFCENINPLQFGYYKQYQQSINSHQRLKYEHQQRQEQRIVKLNKRIEDKINRTNHKNQRIQKAQQDRLQITQQLAKLKQIAEQQKLQRNILEKTLKKQQQIRHNLSSEIESYKRELKQRDYDRSRIDRLECINNSELIESRELQSRIQQQQQYLKMLKQRSYLQKSDMLDRSDYNSKLINLRNEDSRSLRELQIQQQLIYNKLLSPVTQKYSLESSKQTLGMKESGKIYRSTDNLNSISKYNSNNNPNYNHNSTYNLGKSSLCSTKEELRSWKQCDSQISPKYQRSYLHRY